MYKNVYIASSTDYAAFSRANGQETLKKGFRSSINEGGAADTGSANNELYRKLKDSIEFL